MKIKSGLIAVTAMVMMSAMQTTTHAEDGGLRQLEKTQAQLAERKEKAQTNTEEQMAKDTESVQAESKEQTS